MKTKRPVVLLALLVLAALACGMTDTIINNTVGGDSNLKVISTLWSDVPPMDGLKPSQMDMPLPVKLIMRTVMGNLGKLNGQGQDQTTGSIDWIVFTTDKTPADVQNFYTNDRMTAAGWDSNSDSTCFSGSAPADLGTSAPGTSTGTSVAGTGAICVFQKQKDGKQVQLAIIATQDDQNKQQTNIFYLRLEETPTPTPAPK